LGEQKGSFVAEGSSGGIEAAENGRKDFGEGRHLNGQRVTGWDILWTFRNKNEKMIGKLK